jgi:hypothetical protein
MGKRLAGVQGWAAHWREFRDGQHIGGSSGMGRTLAGVQGWTGHWREFRDGQDIGGSSGMGRTLAALQLFKTLGVGIMCGGDKHFIGRCSQLLR